MIETKHIPAMSPPVLHEYLRELGTQWTGRGIVIELGSWLGATAVPLLEGLIKAKYDQPFYCFDRWKANGEQVIKASDQDLELKLGQDLLPIFKQNVTSVYANIKTYKGDLPTTLFKFPKQPIEICIFDAPKAEPVFTGCIERLRRNWIPGITILGLLDYNFYKSRDDEKFRQKYLAPVRFMEKYKHHFEKIKEWEGGSEVFFRFIK